MRVIHVVPRIADEASGPSYSVPALCKALSAQGCVVDLVTLDGGRVVEQDNLHHQRWPVSWSMHRLGVSSTMRRALMRAAQSADIVHGHSLWMLPNVYPAWAARSAGRPLVMSPRGTLSAVALQRSPAMKSLFWRLLQGPAVRQAACLHVTSEQERGEVRNFGLDAPTAMIPNGIDIPDLSACPTITKPHRVLLYLGRLHPIKGIDLLLRAWALVQSEFPDWTLRIVGPDENHYRGQLEALATQLGLARVVFAGPRYGADKWAEYAAADAYVLPSRSENFGMSVAEALGSGLPVIATTGTPWADLDRRGAGWSVAGDANAIAGTLRQALALPPDRLAAMGRRGREWMSAEFSWATVAQDMIRVYRWLFGDGPPPKTVSLARP